MVAAAAAPARLVYEPGDSGCPSRERLVSAVAARLGPEPFDEAASDAVEVTLARTGAGLTARVVRRTQEAEVGRRELSSPTTDCSELFRAVELAVAIAIDPRAGLVRPPPPPPTAPTSQPPAESAAPPAESIAQAPPAPPQRAFGFHAGAGIAGVVGSGPRPTGGVTVLSGLTRGWVEVGVGGRFELPVRLALESGASVSTEAFLGELSGCGVWRGGRLCALAAAGALRIVGQGLSLGTVDRAAAVVLAGVRLAYDWRVATSLVVRPSLDVSFALTRTSVTSDTVVWQTPPVTGSLAITFLWSQPEAP